MKNIKTFFLLLILTCLSNSAISEIQNPFLKNKKSKQTSYSSDKRTILIVFDASGSMEEKIQSETKIHIAKRVLEDVLLKTDSNINIGFRAYGLGEPSGNPYIDCSDSKLLVLPQTGNRRFIISEVHKILPRGATPITHSLSQAIQDLAPYKGEKSIILISDGLETCGGDPCQLAENINNANIDIKINVVGFGIRDDWDAQEQLMCIATNTMGRYFSANSAEDLTKGLFETINKSVTGKIILKEGNEIEVMTEETEGYENLPKLQSEKINLIKKQK